ncbi:DUF6705 family protein [Psychroserpens algicola]|uniref:DUF6705 domain-containing protein n=1 Tax=Psychroserpens algicola TaxID=1719034 RepID=A0ABT0H3V0_9FLAO|nr:DUF6705 family protein [Psychroserpens algicola]MCK8479059.1 hypothetical protein [Psychroserpens algicola]
MKKIIVIGLLVLSNLSIAQGPIISLSEYDLNTEYTPNMYISDIDGLFNPFVGTWEWTNGNETLTIVLYKVPQVHTTVGERTFYCDELYGKYKYEQNGTTIINTIDNVEPTIAIKGFKPQGNKVEFLFDDTILEKQGFLEVELINAFGLAKINLKLINRKGVSFILQGDSNYIDDFSIPHNENFVLSKVN